MSLDCYHFRPSWCLLFRGGGRFSIAVLLFVVVVVPLPLRLNPSALCEVGYRRNVNPTEPVQLEEAVPCDDC